MKAHVNMYILLKCML